MTSCQEYHLPCGYFKLNNLWIDINLPWYINNCVGPQYLDYPDHSQQIKEMFGSEFEILKVKVKDIPRDSPLWDEENLLELVNQKDPMALDLVRYREISRKINKWKDEQVDNKEIEEKNKVILKQYKEQELNNPICFSKSKYCVPGVLIEFESEGQIKQQLLGHLNLNGGVCDDCKGINNTDLVIRCKIVWSENE